MTAAPRREIGTVRGAGGRYTRLADRVVLHDGVLEAGELLDRVVTPQTRYLVLDLDRTFHYRRNMGELLGWELGAYLCYGDEVIAAHDAKGKRGRFVLAWNRPLQLIRYLGRGVRLWTYAGLTYLLYVKIGMRFALTRRWIYRRFGPSPVEAVQQIPRLALMHQLTDLPLEDLRRLMRRLWRRHEPDQVFFRADFDRLRARCPELKIVISSASPQPVLEIAREELGVDDILYTAVEVEGGFLSAPPFLHRWFLRLRRPRRIAPPSTTVQNAAHTKVDRLLERYPDFMDVETVGISDTGYGEDHAWAQYFTRVVDVNSSSPYAPIVTPASPLQEVHSAQVLSAAERRRRDAGERRYLARGRRQAPHHQRQFLGDDMQLALMPLTAQLETLAELYQRSAAAVGDRRRELQVKLSETQARLEEAVGRYNASMGRRRDGALLEIRRLLRQQRRVMRQLVEVERPLARLRGRIESTLATARARLNKLRRPKPKAA